MEEAIQSDRPEDVEWNWSEIYTTEISHKVLPCGYVTHLKIYRNDGQEIVGNWDLLQRIKTDVLGMEVVNCIAPVPTMMMRAVRQKSSWSWA